MLLGRGGALRFRGLLAFFTWPGTWATSLKILSLGSPAWDVVVSPFTDVFAGFRLRVLAVGAGELAFLDWGSPDLAFLRRLRTGITKVDSKVRSLDSPACTGTIYQRLTTLNDHGEYPRLYGANARVDTHYVQVYGIPPRVRVHSRITPAHVAPSAPVSRCPQIS